MHGPAHPCCLQSRAVLAGQRQLPRGQCIEGSHSAAASPHYSCPCFGVVHAGSPTCRRMGCDRALLSVHVSVLAAASKSISSSGWSVMQVVQAPPPQHPPLQPHLLLPPSPRARLPMQPTTPRPRPLAGAKCTQCMLAVRSTVRKAWPGKASHSVHAGMWTASVTALTVELSRVWREASLAGQGQGGRLVRPTLADLVGIRNARMALAGQHLSCYP